MRNNKVLKIVFYCLSFLLISFFSLYDALAFSSNAISVSESDIDKPNNNTHFVINNWKYIPHKDQRTELQWIDYVNQQLKPDRNWSTSYYGYETNISAKCLSYAASTTNDWFHLETGMIMTQYTDIVNNKTQNGTDPRELEQIYNSRYSTFSRKYDYPFDVPLYGGILKDIVTGEEIPYNTEGYADILISPPSAQDWNQRPDENFDSPGNFNYTILPSEYFKNWKYKEIPFSESEIKKALKKYGILYTHIKNDFLNIPFFPWEVHSVPIIGYGTYEGDDVFWIHESYTDDYPSNFSKYKAIKFKNEFNQKLVHRVFAFYDPQWPTDSHDFRRTGFTLLKGDMDEEPDVNTIDTVLHKNISEDVVLRPSVADLDGNSYMDVVTVMYDKNERNQTTVYGIERNIKEKPWWKRRQPDEWQSEEKWKQDFGGSPILLPPTLGNIDSNPNKEVILGFENGTIVALNISTNGKASVKWEHQLTPEFSAVANTSFVELGGGSAIADIDLDGTNEIILTDKGTLGTYDWPGEVYIIDGSSSSANIEGNYTFGNGGAFASVSIANIDDDDNPEIIVPSYYGIYVFDYNTSAPHKLSIKWNNSDGLILGSAVVYDVDRDNEYELIYVTTNSSGPVVKTRYNRLYIRDAKTGANEANSPIELGPLDARVTPTIANLDSDSQAEIVISVRNSPSTELGKIMAFDSSTGINEWNFTDGGSLITSFVSPDIADINNDGNYDIVFAENDGTNVFILHNNGTEMFRYDFGALVDSALAIADLDSNGIAEIAVKRAGSPVGILSYATGFNQMPYLNPISNLTAIAGNLININQSGEVTATDPNNDNLTFYYSSPFNSSGLWQSTINDTGNYSILVEVSDGTLSDYQYVDLIVFNYTTKLQNNFTDNTQQTLLNFTAAGNQTVKIRLPKTVNILHSKVKLKGKAP